MGIMMIRDSGVSVVVPSGLNLERSRYANMGVMSL